jgi:IMP dehydrogenase
MASIEAQVEWRGHAASEEGVSAWVESKGSLEKVLSSLEKGIRSGLSYSGATSISDLCAKAKFIRITSAGMHESRTHIHSK